MTLTRAAVAALLLAAAQPVPAQDPGAPQAADPPPAVETGRAALVRGLDKVTGRTIDFEMADGDSVRLGLLIITAGECRYPAEDPASNAYAWLTIREDEAAAPAFQGWMIAAAPALNALDHPRYDVWVIRCSIAEG